MALHPEDRIYVSPDCCRVLSLGLRHWVKCCLFIFGIMRIPVCWLNGGKFWPKRQACTSDAHLHFQDLEKSTCTMTVFSLQVLMTSLYVFTWLQTRKTSVVVSHLSFFSYRWSNSERLPECCWSLMLKWLSVVIWSWTLSHCSYWTSKPPSSGVTAVCLVL